MACVRYGNPWPATSYYITVQMARRMKHIVALSIILLILILKESAFKAQPIACNAPWLVLSNQTNQPTLNWRIRLKPSTVAPDSSPIATDSVYWVQVPIENGLLHAAIAIPGGTGPFPALLILHGTHGFAQEYVQLARRVARQGVVGVAACWFAGRQGAGVRFITPIDCNDAPPLVDVPGVDRFRVARQLIDSLVRKVSALSYVRANQIMLFGHSRGAGAALDYALAHPGRVQGAVLNSGGYPTEVTKRAAAEIKVPILLLHGTADSPTDGGSAVTLVNMARQFEAALRAANKPIAVKYYDGSGHNGIFNDSTQLTDTVHRIARFVRNQMVR